MTNIWQNKKFVIWGLNKFEHTHSYIHLNLYKTLKRNGGNVTWVADEEKNNILLEKDTIVIFVNIAANNLKFFKNVCYVGHNTFKDSKFQEMQNSNKFLHWHISTYMDTGIYDPKGSIAKFDPINAVLFQPYGTPINKTSSFKKPNRSAKYENHVGSVWNDDLNRGNSIVIREFAQSLSHHGIQLRAIEFGKLSTLKMISDRLERHLVSSSFIGSAIHSPHQVEEGNLACRYFKAISFGRLPLTNQSRFRQIFGESIPVFSDLSQGVEYFLSSSPRELEAIHRNISQQINLYSYESLLSRIYAALTGSW